MTMTTVWNTTTRMARTLLTETSQSVQSGCRSMMKKVTNSEKYHVSTSQVRRGSTQEAVGEGAESKQNRAVSQKCASMRPWTCWIIFSYAGGQPGQVPQLTRGLGNLTRANLMWIEEKGGLPSQPRMDIKKMQDTE